MDSQANQLFVQHEYSPHILQTFNSKLANCSVRILKVQKQ
jgi:hypothetical protein